MTQIKVYFASKLHHSEKLKKHSRDGFHFMSRWLETGNLPENNTKPASHWQQENYIDIRASDVVIMYGEEGDNLEGASQEIGYAIAHGKAVYVVVSREFGPKPWMLQGEPVVRRRGSVEQVLNEIQQGLVKAEKMEC